MVVQVEPWITLGGTTYLDFIDWDMRGALKVVQCPTCITHARAVSPLPHSYYHNYAHHFGEKNRRLLEQTYSLGLSSDILSFKGHWILQAPDTVSSQASIITDQWKPAPPEPYNHSEGVSFTPMANFSMQSAEVPRSLCQAPLQTWLGIKSPKLGLGGGMEQSLWPRASSPVVGFPTPSCPDLPFSSGFPHPQGIWLQVSKL